ncbi:MAG: class I SAM-dependent methyltransferase [Eubacterium sp.]|nr:class I SAM-dependent methyltransferase [Eubacterium sp.]
MEQVSSDTAIMQYIENRNNESFDEVIQKDNRWDIFYHLSEMRKALFSWYDFKEQNSILELGGGFGALTGLFCDKCRSVVTIEKNALRAEAIRKRYSERKNLRVLCEDILTWKNEEKFDYIIAVGILETICNGSRDNTDYIQVIERVKDWLAPQGKLLIAVENRFGIRYWCGAVEKHTRKPYGGINNYPLGSQGISFDREQIKHIVKEAGLYQIKFFYPLPDYILPQVIYSQEYLPKSSVKERVIPYYMDNRYLNAYENDLYDDIVNNSAFEFMSNSFLIEGSVKADRSSILYAALTTDRGMENGFATMIRNDHIVEKRALYQKGKEGLRRIWSNMRDLEKRGLHCIQMEWKNESLWMPFVQEHTLCDDLRQLLKQGSREFEQIIQRLFSCILQSSEQLPVTENRLKCLKEYEEELGVILKRAYIDMVPMNCFYVDDDFYFFDQEFIKECFPAKYVWYRVLKYTYFFMPEAEKQLPLENMKKIYGLSRIWQCFEEEESRFVAENRNYDRYQHFRKWAAVNKNDLYSRYVGK